MLFDPLYHNFGSIWKTFDLAANLSSGASVIGGWDMADAGSLTLLEHGWR
jgi:hypothetical protein